MPPVDDSAPFVGHTALLRTLHTQLPLGRNYLLFGGAKMGRTTLLRHLAATLWQRRRQPDGHGEPLVPIYVDLAQAPVAHPAKLAEHLYTQLQVAIFDPWVTSGSHTMRKSELDVRRQPDPWSVFDTACHDLWNALANTPGWCRTLWLFDNFHALFTPPVSRATQLAVTALSDLRVSHRAAAMVMVGDIDIRERTANLASNAKKFRTLRLGVLQETDVAAYLRALGTPVFAPGESLEMLMAYTGRHPYLSTLLCSNLAKAPGTPLVALMQEAQGQAQALFEENLRVLGPALDASGTASIGHGILQSLLQAGGAAEIQHIEMDLAMRPSREGAELLESMGLVQRTLRGTQPLLTAPCAWFNDWYLHAQGRL